MSRFTRFSLGKIWFIDIGPCKRFDIFQLCAIYMCKRKHVLSAIFAFWDLRHQQHALRRNFTKLGFFQVSDIYSMHYTDVSLPTRQEWLLEHYKFSCSCPACRFLFTLFLIFSYNIFLQPWHDRNIQERLENIWWASPISAIGEITVSIEGSLKQQYFVPTICWRILKYFWRMKILNYFWWWKRASMQPWEDMTMQQQSAFTWRIK